MANIVGTLGDDTRVGSNGRDLLDGLAGNDLLHGRGGNDVLYGRAGLDRLFGDGGNDLLVGGLDADFLDGGAGKDTAAYADAAGPVTVDLRAGTASGGAGADTLRGIETVHGSPLEDFLFGSDGVDELRGLLGNDALDGRGGNDRLDGGDGNDRLTGGPGNDGLVGGAGADVAAYAGNRADFTISTSGSRTTVTDRAPTRAGNEGRDTLSGVERIVFADGEVKLGNAVPVVQGDKALATAEDTSAALGIAAPSDADGDALVITVTQIPDAAKGAVLLAGGSAAVAVGQSLTPAQVAGLLFRPVADANGAAGAFAYSVSDGTATLSQRVTLQVTAVDDPVEARADGYAAVEDTVLTVGAAQGVLANDRAGDGGLAAVAGTFATERGGSVVLRADGGFTYTPGRDFFGSDGFTYTARDADGDTATARAALTVAGSSVDRVSTAADGTQGNGNSFGGSFSLDGSKVAFLSDATNLVPGDTNGARDIFIKDLATGMVIRVSTAGDGTQGNGTTGNASLPVFSPDGSKLAFESQAGNLTPDDTTPFQDIFIKDLATGAVTLVSTAADGTQGNSFSVDPVFSPDGSKVAFRSAASNMVPGDTNGHADIFIKDLGTGAVTRVSTAGNGAQADSYNYDPAFSPDGIKIAFTSHASNLVPGGTSNTADVFVKDLTTGVVALINTTADGTPGDRGSGGHHGAVFSPDSSKVAFQSAATNLVPGDTNGTPDIFIKDLATGAVTRVSTAADGTQGNGWSIEPVFSPDGSKVAFYSDASNLVRGDTNGAGDVFIKDLATGTVTLVSTAEGGALGNQGSYDLAFSPDGSKIAFRSGASNLVPGDTNNSFDVFVRDLDDLFPPVARSPTAMSASAAPDLALLVPDPAGSEVG